jgi:hypothetical protein
LVDSLKALDPERPIREADFVATLPALASASKATREGGVSACCTPLHRFATPSIGKALA